MLYFKYNSSFKKAGTLTNLLANKNIVRICNEEEFNKHFAKDENIYAFIDPYNAEINEEYTLNWALSEGEAWDLYYGRADDI